jgi:hypothetical protein
MYEMGLKKELSKLAKSYSSTLMKTALYFLQGKTNDRRKRTWSSA